MELPEPSTPNSPSKNLAAGSILELVKENSRSHIPVFGVSGCGKTRAVIELLSQPVFSFPTRSALCVWRA
ncbi:hypothetical protein B0O80DRAFT_462844 [Mortierella sp. GBAus27b]|nr:hypothetical protein B0O80DRAFT_462844 [Mortierella sp. GBAus27b]